MSSLKTLKKTKGAKHLIIFVHGFTGGEKTFTAKGKHLYEHLDESILKICDIAMFVYHTKLFDIKMIKRVMSVLPGFSKIIRPEFNANLSLYSELLKTHHLNSMNEYSSVSYICHSMGGLVVKDMLVTLQRSLHLNSGFYITLATPHRGVTEAGAVAMLRNLHIAHMVPFSEYLDSLETSWDEVSKRYKRRYYYGIHDTIVSERSASPITERKQLVRVDGTHTSIVKQTSSQSALMKDMSRAIKGFVQSSAVDASQLSNLELVLFYTYKKQNKAYYLARSADRAIADILGTGNLWLCGDSGVGKTNIIQYHLICNNIMTIPIDLSACPSEADSEQIFENIFWMIHTKYGSLLTDVEASAAHSWIYKISSLLCKISSAGQLCLFIDEIQISDNAVFEAFVDKVTALINHYSNACDNFNNIKFVISSRFDPEKCDLKDKSKFYTIFTHHRLEKWTDFEISTLSTIIGTGLKIAVTKDEKAKIIKAAEGSPRRLKIIFKHVYQGKDVQTAIGRMISERVQ